MLNTKLEELKKVWYDAYEAMKDVIDKAKDAYYAEKEKNIE